MKLKIFFTLFPIRYITTGILQELAFTFKEMHINSAANKRWSVNQYSKSRFGRFFVYCCELVGDILGRTLAKGFEKILNIGLTRYRTYLPHQNMFSNLKLTDREFKEKMGLPRLLKKLLFYFVILYYSLSWEPKPNSTTGIYQSEAKPKKAQLRNTAYL